MTRPEPSPLPTAVVLGLSPTGLYAVRELGRAGVPVVGIAESRQSGTASRYLQECLIETDDERRIRWLQGLQRQRRSPVVLIPTSDQDIEFIGRHANRLADGFAFQASYADGTADLLLTKQRFYERCAALGIEYPGLWSCTAGELSTLRSALRYPCLVKPSRVHEAKSFMAGKKGWVVRNGLELDDLARRLPERVGILLVQEIVPGPESNISLFAAYFDTTGGVQQAVTARKLRQYPPGFGSASRVVTTQEDDARAKALALLGGLNYQGIAAAEFKRHPRDGRLKISEVNARPSLWFEVSHAAGKRLCLAAYHDLARTGLQVPEQDQEDGVGWVFPLKDLYSGAFYRLRQNFVLPPPDWTGLPVKRRKTFAVYAADDPMPALAEWGNIGRKIVSRLKNKVQKNPGTA